MNELHNVYYKNMVATTFDDWFLRSQKYFPKGPFWLFRSEKDL